MAGLVDAQPVIEMNIESDFSSSVLADLTRLGLVSTQVENGKGAPLVTEPDLPLFSRLLSAYAPRLVPVSRPGCPVFFCTGLLKSQDVAELMVGLDIPAIPAGGQGGTMADAALGCLGELSERLSLCSLGARDSRIVEFDQNQPQVDFVSLLGLSASQASSAFRELGNRVPGTGERSSDWGSLSDRRIRLRNLQTGEMAQCLSLGVLFQEVDETTGRHLPFATSVGCAVWHDLEGARKRALLELVERDAMAQAWYNRLGISALPEGLLSEVLPPELTHYLNDQPRAWGLYHVETDLAVQVVMAVSHDGYGKGCAFGASAGWDIAQASVGALQEMLQSENALTLMNKAYPVTGKSDETPKQPPRQLAYARERVIFEDLPLKDAAALSETAALTTSSFEALLQSCFDRGIGLWEFDATRQDLGIPCIKLMSAELCTWEPRFGKKRLFHGVVERGLRQTPAKEPEFAIRPFPF
ncbi:YcaO-like family protein [Roseibium aggregatum]|uniref:YcaO-like family protein n=1 Tax=Roseibium aggregatum TaxID=187304 RepID=UPI0003060C8C|nr:YcaO-like family protein [Roseibium aggregatum]